MENFENWKKELIRIASVETNTNESEIKINNSSAKKCYNYGWTPYYTFRETWSNEDDCE